MKRELPPHVYLKKGVLYFQRRGCPTVRIQAAQGTPEFHVEYARLLAGDRPVYAGPRTFTALVAEYVAGPRYRGIQPRTAQDYDKVLAWVKAKLGPLPVAGMQRKDVIRARAVNADRVRFANYIVQVLRILFEQAIDLGWRIDNPAKGVSLLKSGLPPRELHALFVQIFARQNVSQANLAALCKRKGWLTGRTGTFPKGNVPANAGRKGFCAPGSEKGWFKKGAIPHTARGVGHESIDQKDGYVWMIVAERNPHTGAATRRVMKHRWLWEQANGPVPEGNALKCLDGDKTNCDPANWQPIPRALLPRLNGRFGRDYDTAPAEMKPVIMATAKLAQKAQDLRRGKAP